MRAIKLSFVKLMGWLLDHSYRWKADSQENRPCDWRVGTFSLTSWLPSTPWVPFTSREGRRARRWIYRLCKDRGTTLAVQGLRLHVSRQGRGFRKLRPPHTVGVPLPPKLKKKENRKLERWSLESFQVGEQGEELGEWCSRRRRVSSVPVPQTLPWAPLTSGCSWVILFYNKLAIQKVKCFSEFREKI